MGHEAVQCLCTAQVEVEGGFGAPITRYSGEGKHCVSLGGMPGVTNRALKANVAHRS